MLGSEDEGQCILRHSMICQSTCELGFEVLCIFFPPSSPPLLQNQEIPLTTGVRGEGGKRDEVISLERSERNFTAWNIRKLHLNSIFIRHGFKIENLLKEGTCTGQRLHKTSSRDYYRGTIYIVIFIQIM